MRILFIILLFIFLSSNSSSAKNKGKITIEEIESIFFTFDDYDLDEAFRVWFEKSKKESYKKRLRSRGIANCQYNYKGSTESDHYKQCQAKIVKVSFGRSERFQKKRPGDIFYALSALEDLFYTSKKSRSFIKTFGIDMTVTSGNYESKKRPGMRCSEEYRGRMWCRAFNKSTYKKIKKFKLDPSNEKILGSKLIKYIESERMLNNIRKITGINNDYYKTEKYALLGDMLNDTVKDVKKNNVNPELLKRRVILKKYSSKLREIKKKLERDKFKSIDKDVLKLSKIYKNLKSSNTKNEKLINIDKAVDAIFDANKFVQNSVLIAENNKENHLLAISSINFTESLIKSILITIPEKYLVETKELTTDLYEDYDLDELENIINSITKYLIRAEEELDNDKKLISKHINTSKILDELNALGIKNKFNKGINTISVFNIADTYIKDNLNNEILKDIRKIVKKIDRDELDNITKEISTITSEISSDKSIKSTVTSSYPDPKFGGQSLKRLIAISRR